MLRLLQDFEYSNLMNALVIIPTHQTADLTVFGSSFYFIPMVSVTRFAERINIVTLNNKEKWKKTTRLWTLT